MSDQSEFRIRDLHEKRKKAGDQNAPGSHLADSEGGELLPVYRSARHTTGESRPAEPQTSTKRLPFDPGRLLGALRRRWLWVLFWGLLLGGGTAALGYYLTPYRVSVVMFIRDAKPVIHPSLEGGALKPPAPTREMLVNLLSSRTLAERVGEQLTPRMTAQDILKDARVEQQSDAPEKITLHFKGRVPDSLVQLANTYTVEALNMTREDQLSENKWLLGFCGKKLAELDAEYEEANASFLKFQKEEQLIDPDIETQAYLKTHGELQLEYEKARIELEMLQERLILARESGSDDRLDAARERLQDLLTRYTEAHPEVTAQKQVIAALERQLAEAGSAQVTELENQRNLIERRLKVLEQAKNKLQTTLATLSVNGRRYAELKSRVDALQKSRSLLSERMRETTFYEDTSLGNYQIAEAAKREDISAVPRWMKAGTFGGTGCLAGLLLAALTVVGREALDDRLKTREDINRTTGLPVLTSLGDLAKMSLLEREKWAFRAWTLIAGQLSQSANHGLVCGFISARAGEGRSTWIELLAEAASERGLRVLTVTADDAKSSHSQDGGQKYDSVQPTRMMAESSTASNPAIEVRPETSTAKAIHGELPSSAEVVRRLSRDQEITPVVSVPLPDWNWTPDRRRHWHSALAHWRTIESLVILIELPPASSSESILLAESVPQLIWLTGSGQSRARETRMHLETLRHAHCRIAGAVLNREPELSFKS